MRLTLAALALLATIATASAGYTCTNFGNTIVCDGGGQSTTCTRFNNQVICD